MVHERRWRSGATALLSVMALGLTACGADEGARPATSSSTQA